MELKKVHKQDRVRKPQEPYPTTERCRPPLWPPTQCTCIPSSLCCVWVTKWTRDASALRWRPERGPASFRSGVGFLRLSNPVLFVHFFQLHPYSKWSFFRNFSPLVSVLFWGFLNQLSKYNSFHLQIRYHTADDVLIASNEIASATHVRTWHHTADKRVHR